MMMLLLPAAALIALVFHERHERGARDHASVSGVNEYNTPLFALGQMIAAGHRPPQSLVQWAIAEANALGRVDVAQALARRLLQSSPASAMPDYAGVSPSSAAPSPTSAATPPSEVDAFGMPIDTPNVAAPAASSGAPAAVSPLRGVDDGAWSAFTGKLAQSDPSYESPKRVGRYHQSRTRLAELGFDADSIVGNEAMQEAALAADLVDGLAQAQAKGIADAVGTKVDVPGAGAQEVTLSGLLGVMSVAGVRGAHGWLHSEIDRRRFPHSTDLFLRTNGVF